MKISSLFQGEDYLIISLLAIGVLIAGLGVYIGINELTEWLSGSLSQIQIR